MTISQAAVSPRWEQSGACARANPGAYRRATSRLFGSGATSPAGKADQPGIFHSGTSQHPRRAVPGNLPSSPRR